RKLVALSAAGSDTQLDGKPLLDLLLAPTRIYVKPLLELTRQLDVHALAHITGGGLTDNIPRVLPDGLEAVLERRRWHRDPVFDWLQQVGHIERAEMYRTFNCGIGMVAVVSKEHAPQALELFAARGESAQIIGEIRPGSRGVVIVE
ncbi:MAG: phosphoribosylformylglycinamidine cyclo-ligase, partial [Gammaproteobacteria bacterium]|nr:phosphoribosylformylglycinamidine cyclo-ligase [Gammaproteobacteria bacterium]